MGHGALVLSEAEALVIGNCHLFATKYNISLIRSKFSACLCVSLCATLRLNFNSQFAKILPTDGLTILNFELLTMLFFFQPVG